MDWTIEFYAGVKEAILELPPKLQARTIHLLELMEKHGANLGEPHTKALGDGLFEVRAKAREGIARGFFCYMDRNRVKVLHVFMKKDQKIPRKDIKLARERMKEVKRYDPQ